MAVEIILQSISLKVMWAGWDLNQRFLYLQSDKLWTVLCNRALKTLSSNILFQTKDELQARVETTTWALQLTDLTLEQSSK